MSPGKVEMIVDPATGGVVFIHSDEAMALAKGVAGAPTIRRASHVEPDEKGQWWVDLSPSNGPIMGPYPPGERGRALADEADWLRQNRLHVRI